MIVISPKVAAYPDLWLYLQSLSAYPLVYLRPIDNECGAYDRHYYQTAWADARHASYKIHEYPHCAAYAQAGC